MACSPGGAGGCGTPVTRYIESGLEKLALWGRRGLGARRRQVWVRLNHAGRILLSTGQESDIDTELSPLGHDLEDDRIGSTQEENGLSHPGLNWTHRPRASERNTEMERYPKG